MNFSNASNLNPTFQDVASQNQDAYVKDESRSRRKQPAPLSVRVSVAERKALVRATSSKP